DQTRQSEQKAQGKDQSYSKQKDQTVGQGRGERDQTRRSDKQDKSTTTGANTKDNAQGKDQGKNAQQGQSTTTGANTKPSNAPAAQQGQGTTTGTNTQGQTNTQAQTQGGTSQSMSGRVQVSAQQQTRLQQSVLNSRNVARVNASSINFRVN